MATHLPLPAMAEESLPSVRRARTVPGEAPERSRVGGAHRVVAFDLIAGGVLLAALSLLGWRLHPASGVGLLLTGVGGSTGLVVWGVLASRGCWWRAGALVNLFLLAAGFAFEAAGVWSGAVLSQSHGRMLATILMVAMILCLGLICTLWRAGSVQTPGSRCGPVADRPPAASPQSRPSSPSTHV